MKNNKNSNLPKETWYNSDGWSGGDGWSGAAGQNGGDWSANGGGQNPGMHSSSMAYILQMVNACTTAIANVDIGDAATNRTATNFGQSTNITITSTIPGVTYLEYLATSETSPFEVGLTMIISTSAGQLDQAIAVTHRNPGGKRQDFIIMPTLSPFQTQTDRITDDTTYLMDGMCRLRWNQINASATVTCRQYIKGKFSPIQIVADRPSLGSYQAPNINKLSPGKNMG